MAEVTRQEELVMAALSYAERGWQVFPCKPDKKPYTFNGFNDATVDEEQIYKWWTQFPEAKIGIATGKKSGIWVLDIDVKHGDGYKSLAEHLGLPIDWISAYAKDWLMQETQSGGLHIFFKYEDGIKSRTGVIDHIDVRGDGGYVVVSPSTGYNWLCSCPVSSYPAIDAPAILIELVRVPDPPLFVPSVTYDYDNPGTFDVDNVEMIPQGHRDNTINRLAWSMKGRNVPLDEAMQKIAEIAQMKCSPSFSVKVAQKKVRDAYSKG